MAAVEPRRRFVTRVDVDDAAAAGVSLHLRPHDVVTDEAAQRARDRGVTLVRESAAGSSGSASPAADAAAAAALRAAVRAAVVAELGHEPAGLDAALDRALASRR